MLKVSLHANLGSLFHSYTRAGFYFQTKPILTVDRVQIEYSSASPRKKKKEKKKKKKKKKIDRHFRLHPKITPISRSPNTIYTIQLHCAIIYILYVNYSI